MKSRPVQRNSFRGFHEYAPSPGPFLKSRYGQASIFFFAAQAVRSEKFQCGIQRIHELADFERLGEIAEESGLQAFRDIAGHGIGADHQHRDVRCCRVFSQYFQNLETADSRQVDIRQDDIRQGAACPLDTKLAVLRTEQTNIGSA